MAQQSAASKQAQIAALFDGFGAGRAFGFLGAIVDVGDFVFGDFAI